MKHLLLFFIMLYSVSIYAHEGVHLGKIHFPTTGKKSAQAYFENGVMLLHSFEYPEARLAFQRAQKVDANFVLAYWGEAMTYNHPLWGEQDYQAATKVLDKYHPNSHQTLSMKEIGLMQAIHVLYGEGEKKIRDKEYAIKMRELYRQYPLDDELASFYALALLGTVSERDLKVYMQAAGIADEIFSRNPLHPGALHYAIHSYDDPIHAPLGLRAARAYAKIAPDSAHALHMPSHIFMAMGLWPDVIASNKKAWEAGLKQNITNNPKLYNIDDLHAAEWLNYAYLQQKNYAAAYALTKKVEQIAEKSNTPMAKWYYSLMRAAYIIESGDVKADLKSLPLENVELSAQANNDYANALIALHHNDIKKAKEILQTLQNLIPKKTDAEVKDYFTAILPSGVINLKIVILELQADISLKENNIAQAIHFLNIAKNLEDKVSVGYGPPLPVQPSYEKLAELLCKQGDYQAAYQEYSTSLQRMPNRLKAEQGLTLVKQHFIANKLPIPAEQSQYFNRLLLPDYPQ